MNKKTVSLKKQAGLELITYLSREHKVPGKRDGTFIQRGG